MLAGLRRLRGARTPTQHVRHSLSQPVGRRHNAPTCSEGRSLLSRALSSYTPTGMSSSLAPRSSALQSVVRQWLRPQDQPRVILQQCRGLHGRRSFHAPDAGRQFRLPRDPTPNPRLHLQKPGHSLLHLQNAMRRRRRMPFLGVSSVSELFGHAAFALAGVAYLEPDILNLRILSVAAGMGSIIFSFFHPVGVPLWLPIRWNALFCTINCCHIWYILSKERQAELLPPQVSTAAKDRICLPRAIRIA